MFEWGVLRVMQMEPGGSTTEIEVFVRRAELWAWKGDEDTKWRVHEETPIINLLRRMICKDLLASNFRSLAMQP